MTSLQVTILAIVQGLTEFLPISSSGHLVLVPFLFGWDDQGLAFDVAVHFGSLLAVLVFFRRDIAGLLRGSLQVLRANVDTIESRMAFGIGLGTIPAALAGLFLRASGVFGVRKWVNKMSSCALYMRSDPPQPTYLPTHPPTKTPLCAYCPNAREIWLRDTWPYALSSASESALAFSARPMARE